MRTVSLGEGTGPADTQDAYRLVLAVLRGESVDVVTDTGLEHLGRVLKACAGIAGAQAVLRHMDAGLSYGEALGEAAACIELEMLQQAMPDLAGLADGLDG